MEHVLIASGGNLPGRSGDALATQLQALAFLRDGGLIVDAFSGFWRTSPVPRSDQPDFVNAVVAARTKLSPDALMHWLHEVETAHGRQRSERWQARTLDLDLLAYGALVLPDAQAWHEQIDIACQDVSRLTLPHPRLHLRRFVLAPLTAIRPDWCHPVLGSPAHQLLAHLPASADEKCEAMDQTRELLA